jgi:hypothetical protein
MADVLDGTWNNENVGRGGLGDRDMQRRNMHSNTSETHYIPRKITAKTHKIAPNGMGGL